MRPRHIGAALVWLSTAVGTPMAHAQAHTASAVAPGAPTTWTWTLALPAGERIRYEGLVNLDRAGLQQGQMLYPAPGLIGLVVAVTTHGVIANSMRNAEKSRLQEEADAVLQPYLAVLNGLGDEALAQDGLARVKNSGRGRWHQTPGDDEGTPPWRVEGLPVFRLTQDQAALVLDHAVRIQQGSGPSATPTFEGMIRVVSTPLDGDSPQAHWLAEDGKHLRDTLADLYARSLEIALQRASGSPSSTAGAVRTVRYEEGRSGKVERARVIDVECNRWLVENLRGWLLSVPVVPAAGAACPEANPGPQPR